MNRCSANAPIAAASAIVTGTLLSVTRSATRVSGAFNASAAAMLTPTQAATELQQAMPAEAAAFLLDTLRARVASPGPTTETVREVTGHPAHTYRQWAEYRRDDLTANP